MIADAADGQRTGIVRNTTEDGAFTIVVTGADQNLGVHERGGRGHLGHLSDSLQNLRPGAHAELAPDLERHGVRARPEDLLAQVLLQSAHHPDHHDERHHPDRDPAHGDEGDEGQKATTPAARQIPTGQLPLEARLGPLAVRGLQCRRHVVAGADRGRGPGRRRDVHRVPRRIVSAHGRGFDDRTPSHSPSSGRRIG